VKFSGVQLTPVLLPERTGAPPLLRERPRGGGSRLAGSALQQSGQGEVASGEKMDDVALTAAHNSLPCLGEP